MVDTHPQCPLTHCSGGNVPLRVVVGRCSVLHCVKGDPPLPSSDIQGIVRHPSSASHILLSGILNIKGVKERFKYSPEATCGGSVILWAAVGMHTVLWHDLD